MPGLPTGATGITGTVDMANGIANTVGNAVDTIGNAASSINQLALDVFAKAAFFSEKGVAYFAGVNFHGSFTSISKMGDILQGILTTSSDGDTAAITKVFSDFIVNIRNVAIEPLKVVGFAIAFAFLMITLFQLAMEDRMSPEIFVKHFAKLGLSLITIAYSDKLVEYVLLFSDALASWAGGLMLGTGDGGIPSLERLTNVFYAASEKKLINQWVLLFYVIMNGMLISIVGLVLECVAYVIAFSRMLELSVRAAGMPIGLALLADDGWRGAGGRYIKKFVAVCCQSFVLILIAKVATGIIAQSLSSIIVSMESSVYNNSMNVLSDMTGGMVISIGVAIAAVTAMMKSIGLVNDMFGA